MAEVLQFLNATGSVGIWVLIGVVWRFDKRLAEISFGLREHIALDDMQHSRTDKRLENLENP